MGVKTWLEAQGKRWSCPECGTRFHWYSEKCDKCGAKLYNAVSEEEDLEI